MTSEKATQWAKWWAAQAEANRNRRYDYMGAAERRTAINDAQFMVAYWAARAQEAASA